MIAFLIKICAAGLLLLGVLVAVYGTYLMTLAYHPFKTKLDLVKNILRVSWLFATFRFRAAHELVDTVEQFAEVNPEDRTKSLRGIYFLFLSFVLQTAGSILAVIDVLVTSRAETHVK